MLPSPEFLRETHLVGRSCREHRVDREHYPFLRSAPFVWIGHSVLRAPYRMVRLRSVHSHMVASVQGRGRTLIDGRVVEWRPGQVLLAPVGAHHAFEPTGSAPWVIAWVFFDDNLAAPTLKVRAPELIDADSGDFVSVIRLLTREAAGAAQPAVMDALVTVLDACARRMAGADAVDPRLLRLWCAVEADLAHAWTIPEMARCACMSEEHLRRLCHRHYRRSPAGHLTLLRLRRAGSMMRSSTERLDAIAQRVGYASVYSFSAAFRRWSGVPPARYRRGGS